MKNNLPASAIIFKTILLVACFMAAILYNKSKAAGLPRAPHSTTKVIVNFRNNAEKHELTIRVKSGTDTIMQLFIFTADGILVKEVAVSAQKITTIQSLHKGHYLYECFDNDRRLKSGSLLIE
ncbi:MAG: hypothetical protein WKI04_03715 [Ferruginibacter sp.]